MKKSHEIIEDKEKEISLVKQTLQKREKELTHVIAKLDDEQNLIMRNMKQIKELGSRVEDLEEELETERQTRARMENQRNLLNQELGKLKADLFFIIY